MNKTNDNNFGFFITPMPETRPADYYPGCLEGSVFTDFDNYNGSHIRLKRISFEGYGCCNLGEQAISMSHGDSQAFKETFEAQLADQLRLAEIVKKTIARNRQLIWEEALVEYGLT